MVHRIMRIGSRLFPIFMFGGLFWLMLIETTFNSGFDFMMKILALPLALIVFSFTYINQTALLAYSNSLLKLWGVAIAFYLLLLLFSWPYLLVVNAVFRDEKPVVYTGEIIKKYEHRSSKNSNSYLITIRDIDTNEDIVLKLPYLYFQEAQVGQRYCTVFYRGLLGIPFRWRYVYNVGFDDICAKNLEKNWRRELNRSLDMSIPSRTHNW